MRISRLVLLAVAISLLSSSALAQTTFGQGVGASHAHPDPRVGPPEPTFVEWNSLPRARQQTCTRLETKFHKSIESKAKLGLLTKPVFLSAKVAYSLKRWYDLSFKVSYSNSKGKIQKLHVTFWIYATTEELIGVNTEV